MFVKVVALLLAICLAVESAVLAGAPVDADINSPEAQDALRFAAAQYNADSDSTYTSQIVKVIKAQVQLFPSTVSATTIDELKKAEVVSGFKYIFTVDMAKTSCKKGEDENTCTVNSDPAIAQPHECKLAVWSQPWLHSMTLVENTC